MHLPQMFDVIIVGGGPAGSSAGGRLASNGLKVLIIERKDLPGRPVRCGELTESRELLKDWTEIDDSWIETEINGVVLTTTCNTTYKKNAPGIALKINREKFDRFHLEKAIAQGAVYLGETRAIGLIRHHGEITGVSVVHNGVEKEFKARAIIGADGVESRLGRWAGIRTTCSVKDLYSCVQYNVEGIGLSRDYVHFYVGKTLAPYGYIWIFPKGERHYNVGIAQLSNPHKKQNAEFFLKKFMGLFFPGTKIIEKRAGGIACSGGIYPLAKDNVLLVGDAAHHAHSFSGGGILNALKDGVIASEYITKVLNNGSTVNFHGYTKYWRRNFKTRLNFQKRVRNFFYSLDDDELVRLLETAKNYLKNKSWDRDFNELALIRALVQVSPLFLMKVGRFLRK